jgi:5'-phosphate synthase pdxT subunit
LPGGESTVMGKLLRELELFQPIQDAIRQGLPVFGTCAGLLLLAQSIENDDRSHLATMDITAKRNAYGRQLGSFYTEAPFGQLGKVPMTFIRAPYIAKVGDKAQALAEIDGKIVAAQQDNQLVTAFHPELLSDLSVHQYFLDMIR